MIFRPHRFRASLAAWMAASAIATLGSLATPTGTVGATDPVSGQSLAAAARRRSLRRLSTHRSHALPRRLARRERLESGEYNEALAFLQQLLDRNEDVFVDDGADPNQLRGLKAAARELIAKLPGRRTRDVRLAPHCRRAPRTQRRARVRRPRSNWPNWCAATFSPPRVTKRRSSSHRPSSIAAIRSPQLTSISNCSPIRLSLRSSSRSSRCSPP